MSQLIDLGREIVAYWARYFASETIESSVVFSLIVTLLVALVASAWPAPSGPLHVCGACGWSSRRRARESRSDFTARLQAHALDCQEARS